ncbi:MAG: hypothetical protein NVSMB30_00050 [Hymenobacter sp.]
MKNTLLALTVFAFVGTAAFANDGHGKIGKKETCTKGERGTASCCMKKDAKTTATVKAPAAATTK